MEARADIRDTVTGLFEKARQNKETSFEPERFLGYLTAPPTPHGRRCADTFAGRRRFVRFLDSVQLAFGICFTAEEWDRAYTMDEFLTVVASKASKRGPALC
jgi:hypothetical protein